MSFDETTNLLDEPLRNVREGRYATALEQFETLESVWRDPQMIGRLRLSEAACLTDMNRGEEALRRISSLDRNHLDWASLIDYEFEFARIERSLGRLVSALEHIRLATQLYESSDDPGLVQPYVDNIQVLRGILEAETGHCEEAVPLLRSAPRHHPGWAEATNLLADCYYKNGDYEEALIQYIAVIEAPSPPVDSRHRDNAIRNVGMICFYGGEYSKAVSYLDRVKGSYTDYPDITQTIQDMISEAQRHLQSRIPKE